MLKAKISRFARLGRRQQYLLCEAVAALAASSAAIHALPFRWAVRMGSHKLPAIVADDRSQILHDIRWAIEAAAAAVPWRTVCLQKGLALQWMVRRRGIDGLLHYGLAKEESGELKAHVWVAVGENLVIGGEIASEYRSVAIFPKVETATTA